MSKRERIHESGMAAAMGKEHVIAWSGGLGTVPCPPGNAPAIQWGSLAQVHNAVRPMTPTSSQVSVLVVYLYISCKTIDSMSIWPALAVLIEAVVPTSRAHPHPTPSCNY